MSKPKSVIIIKKKKIVAGDGHGGSAWKIAYADFVTAMMAFFLLMWLINVTTKEQRDGISNYFNLMSTDVSASGANGILQGETLSSTKSGPSDPTSSSLVAIQAGSATETETETESTPSDPKETAIDRAIAEREEQNFKQIEDNLRQALNSSPELADIAQNLLIERTPDGLRIQLIDREKFPMFALASSQPLPKTEQLLRLVAGVIKRTPNPVAISGHTDSLAFNRDGYGNWELSSDRANAARRSLVSGGLEDIRLSRVLGLADRQPLIMESPNDARNRRISILLMSEKKSAAR